MLYSLFEFLLADVRLASCEASPPHGYAAKVGTVPEWVLGKFIF